MKKRKYLKLEYSVLFFKLDIFVTYRKESTEKEIFYSSISEEARVISSVVKKRGKNLKLEYWVFVVKLHV